MGVGHGLLFNWGPQLLNLDEEMGQIRGEIWISWNLMVLKATFPAQPPNFSSGEAQPLLQTHTHITTKVSIYIMHK